MNIYFGDFVTTVSTLMVCAVVFYIIYTAVKQKQIEHWGRRIALLALFGLLTCCFVATRDDYYLSVQASFDSAVTAGLFKIDSLQSTLCCIGGAIIAFSSLTSIFIKSQKYRKAMFFVLSAAIILKIIIIEISRWLV